MMRMNPVINVEKEKSGAKPGEMDKIRLIRYKGTTLELDESLLQPTICDGTTILKSERILLKVRNI